MVGTQEAKVLEMNEAPTKVESMIDKPGFNSAKMESSNRGFVAEKLRSFATNASIHGVRHTIGPGRIRRYF